MERRLEAGGTVCHKPQQQCLEAIALSCSAPGDDSSENVGDGLEKDRGTAAGSHEKQWQFFWTYFNPHRLYFLHLSVMCVYNTRSHTCHELKPS